MTDQEKEAKKEEYITTSTYVPKTPIVEKMRTLIQQKHDEKLERERLASQPKKPFIRDEPRVGRNDPCPCGSGKKYKKCCLAKEEEQ